MSRGAWDDLDGYFDAVFENIANVIEKEFRETGTPEEIAELDKLIVDWKGKDHPVSCDCPDCKEEE